MENQKSQKIKGWIMSIIALAFLTVVFIEWSYIERIYAVVVLAALFVFRMAINLLTKKSVIRLIIWLIFLAACFTILYNITSDAQKSLALTLVSKVGSLTIVHIWKTIFSENKSKEGI